MKTVWWVTCVFGAASFGACNDDEIPRDDGPELADEGDDGGDGDGGGFDDGDDGGGPADGGPDDGGPDDGDDGPADDTGDDGRPSDDDSSGDDSGMVEPCDATSVELVPEGWVEASSEFSTFFGGDYPAELSVDGDVGSAWFSEGADVDGTASTYQWTTTQTHCIDQLQIIGNADHANPDFREGFGFASLTVELFDDANELVFDRTYALDGSPDPTVTVEADGVLANRVLLTFEGHEAPDCGGFTELSITGRNRQ